MKKPFQVGDRVRVFGCGVAQNYIIDGVIAYFITPIKMSVSYGNQHALTAHPKQCRRLVKWKGREWWLTPAAAIGNGEVYIISSSPISNGIRVREVK